MKYTLFWETHIYYEVNTCVTYFYCGSLFEIGVYKTYITFYCGSLIEIRKCFREIAYFDCGSLIGIGRYFRERAIIQRLYKDKHYVKF